jgi:hypothetical protein
MPIPKPGPKEPQKDFLSRCMSFMMGEGTKDAAQCTAICHSQWDNKKKDEEAPKRDTIPEAPTASGGFMHSGKPQAIASGTYPEIDTTGELPVSLRPRSQRPSDMDEWLSQP